MNDRAISLNAVIDILKNQPNVEPSYLSQNDVIDRQDTIDEVMELPSVTSKTGHWIGIDEEPHEDYECDVCGYVVSVWTANIEPQEEYKFCPNCGAKMVEPQERSEE